MSAIRRSIIAKISSTSWGRNHFLRNMSHTNDELREAFIVFCTEYFGREIALRLDKYLVQIIFKVMFLVSEELLNPDDLDLLAAPFNKLAAELRKPRWNAAELVARVNVLQNILVGNLQALVRGNTLNRLDYLHLHFGNQDILETFADLSPTQPLDLLSAKMLIADRIRESNLSPTFMTDYCKLRQGLERSAYIDGHLEVQRHREGLKFKVLLLGAGESGKSTIMNQLQRLQNEREKVEVRYDADFYRTVLHDNSLEAIQCLLGAFREKIGELSQPEFRSAADTIMKMSHFDGLTPEIAEKIQILWSLPELKNNINRLGQSFYIPDSAPFYFDNVVRFARPSFTPSADDMVMARVRTTGVRPKTLRFPPVEYMFVDVGGQRSERKKWLSFFDDVKAIFFVVNLSGYNKITFECSKTNRLHESLELFKSTMNNPIFADTPVVMLLNKNDLFEPMLKRKDLVKCFPNYRGSGSPESAIQYITRQFWREMPHGRDFRECYVLSARFRDDVRRVFNDVMSKLSSDHKTDIEQHRTALRRDGEEH
eukprot:237395_1